RRLPQELQDAAPHGTDPGRAEDDPGPREAARGDGRGRREAAGSRRSDHPVDDGPGKRAAESDRRLPAQAHRERIGDDRGGSQSSAGRAQADGEAHEGRKQRQDARSRRPDGTGPGSRSAAGSAKSDKIQQTQEATEIEEVIVWPYA